MDPVHNFGFAWMIERFGDNHYHSVFQFAAWRDAKGKVTDLPIQDLPPMRFAMLHPGAPRRVPASMPASLYLA